MTAPSARVRELTYLRDGFHCVTCGRREGLQWQHRESSGHGGRGKKAAPLTPADGVTSCWSCNPRYESDLQLLALSCGWKLKRNRLVVAAEIPYFDDITRMWWLPDVFGGRVELTVVDAVERLTVAGNIQAEAA